MLKVVTLSEELYEGYSTYVSANSHPRIGHDLEWALTLRDTYGASIEHLVVLDEDNIVGICPLFLCEPLFGGAHLQTSLFPSYFGPLYDSDSVLDVLLDAIVEKASHLEYAEILSPNPLPADERLPYLEQLDITYRLPLNNDLESIYKNIRRNYKRILKDQKFHEDVQLVVDSSGELVGEFYELYSYLYARKHGFIPHTKKLFQNIFSNYKNGTARIYIAKHNEHYIGGIFTFWKHGEIYCGWSALDLKTTYYPMHFLIWQMIQDGVAQGYNWFNHGEALKTNENLRLFKKGWGMEESDTYRYFVPGQLDKPNIRLFDRFLWTKKIIAYLPIQVTRSLLSPLIRYFL